MNVSVCTNVCVALHARAHKNVCVSDACKIKRSIQNVRWYPNFRTAAVLAIPFCAKVNVICSGTCVKDGRGYVSMSARM
jgi:hypothetical protein